MSRQAECLGDVATERDVIVSVRCSRCGAPLGDYSAGLRFPEGDYVVLSEPGATRRVLDAREITGDLLRAHEIGLRGPRTQPGLYEERFGGRVYLRKRCSCPANDKRRMDGVGELPITRRGDGTMVVVF